MALHQLSQRLNSKPGAYRQRGALTLFTAVLVLFLMTLMLFYASRVSLFETRISGNEVRQKQAFHGAEAAIEWAVMYVLNNSARILSSRVDEFPDGQGGFTGDGWFATGQERWVLCTATDRASATHPCGGDYPMTQASWYYDDPATNSGIDSVVASNTVPGLATGSTARLSMILCFVDLDDPASNLCGNPPTTTDDEATSSLVIWMLGYGYSDCTDITNVATCQAEATVARPISNFRALQGSPTVPLVSKSTFPPTGTAEVVGNPNGGGWGVSLTTWLNDNLACPPVSDIISSGSWQTCEFEEWYHTSEYPAGVECTDNNCFCGDGGNNVNDFMSWRKSGQQASDCTGGSFINGDTCVNIDIIVDPLFPCDLFEFYFGYPDHEYAKVMSLAQVVPDCSGMGPTSSGMYWVTGDCTLNANLKVGTPNNPVILITAGTETKLNGGVILFGLLYVFDEINAGHTLETLGSATVYGSVVVDATLDKVQGTFQIVHADGVSANAGGIAGVGSVNGGWRDWGLPEIGW